MPHETEDPGAPLPVTDATVQKALDAERRKGRTRGQVELAKAQQEYGIQEEELAAFLADASATEVRMAERQRAYTVALEALKAEFETDMAVLRSEHTTQLAQVADIETVLDSLNAMIASLRKRKVRL